MLASFAAVALPAAETRAELRAHALAGVTHAVGGSQSSEYGAGGGGELVAEVPLHPILGAQVALGGVALAKGDRPSDPTIADHGGGSALLATVGMRVTPLGMKRVAGPWIDFGGGFARTGSRDRGALETHLGYDFRVSGRWDVGPFIGYTQVLQPDDSLRPDDARIAWLGVAFSLGAQQKKPAPAPAPQRDTIGQAPPPPPPEPVVETPPPPPDRDGDGVVDASDACPDVPGVATDDPKTTGCPPSDNGVRVAGDKIVIDEIIHFDNDSPRVRHVSWAIVQKVAELINATPEMLEVEIEGHADFVGTEEHNLRLSWERAESVKRLLIHFGVDSGRVKTKGFGKGKPRVGGYGEEQRAQNRRVEFTITRAQPATVGTR